MDACKLILKFTYIDRFFKSSACKINFLFIYIDSLNTAVVLSIGNFRLFLKISKRKFKGLRLYV